MLSGRAIGDELSIPRLLAFRALYALCLKNRKFLLEDDLDFLRQSLNTRTTGTAQSPEVGPMSPRSD